MKRIRLLVLLGAVAVALPLALSTAHATGTTSSVSIHEQADYDAVGFVIDVGLNVRCQGDGTLATNGLVSVTVDQYPPETPYPVATGSGPQSVVCDGKTHTVGVTLVGEGFDAGRAKATATFTPGAGGGNSVTATRWITLIEV
jgi:hypothetical protein